MVWRSLADLMEHTAMKSKFKSKGFKGTLGCASSKGDVQRKTELNLDKGTLTERK